MIRISAAGRTDTGRVREANEDAFHVGDSVYAVADGMGGHLAGEVASSLALGPIADLDGRVFADDQIALAALRDAVAAANRAVAAKAARDPAMRGMGTTLTAVLVEGRRAHIAHVGDSRAYLHRGGEFAQLTTDHTLVQKLIDEGRLTREQADHHPHRSVITRAIGVEDSIDVDAMTLEIEPGDRLLVCSDGLTGPVDDAVLARELSDDHATTDEMARRLIDLANRNGGPDNITVVLLEFEELLTAPAPVKVRSGGTDPEGDFTERMSRLGGPPNLAGVPGGGTDQPRSRWPLVGGIVVGVVFVLALMFGALQLSLSRSYYVGVSGQQVTIYRGVPMEFGPFSLSSEFERTALKAEDVPPDFQDDLRDGIAAADLADARDIVANFVRQRDLDQDPGNDTSSTGTDG